MGRNIVEELKKGNNTLTKKVERLEKENKKLNEENIKLKRLVRELREKNLEYEEDRKNEQGLPKLYLDMLKGNINY